MIDCPYCGSFQKTELPEEFYSAEECIQCGEGYILSPSGSISRDSYLVEFDKMTQEMMETPEGIQKLKEAIKIAVYRMMEGFDD